MDFVSVYKWKCHFGVYPAGTFIVDFRIVKEGDGKEPDRYITVSTGKFVLTFGKYHHVVVQ